MTLKDKIIAITRSETEAVEFSQLVAQHGGRTIPLQATDIVPSGPQAAQDFLFKLREKKCDYCAFMSPHGVNILFDMVGKELVQVLRSTTVIAIGPKTKQTLAMHGIESNLVPKTFSSEGLVNLMAGLNPEGKRIIIPRSDAADEFAAKSLTDLKMEVYEVQLYTIRTSTVTPIWNEFSTLLNQRKISAVIFTSASNVRSFFELLDKVFPNHNALHQMTKVISIGPLTSKFLSAMNVEYLESKEHTIEGTLDLAIQVL